MNAFTAHFPGKSAPDKFSQLWQVRVSAEQESLKWLMAQWIGFSSLCKCTSPFCSYPSAFPPPTHNFHRNCFLHNGILREKVSEDNENIWQSYKLRDMQKISRGFSLQHCRRDSAINASLITDSYESVGNQTCFSHFSHWQNEVLRQGLCYKVC